MDAMTQLRRLIAPLSARVATMLSRAVLRAINDAGGFQLVQVGMRQGELRDDVEHFQPYGLTFRPLEGAQAVVAYLGGCGNHPVALVVADPRHRLRGLEPGEVALYTDEGDKIVLKRGRTIEIETATLVVKASGKMRVEAPQLEVTGEIIDRVDSSGRSMSHMRQVYDSHTHPDAQGGNTGTPNQSTGGA